MKTLLSSTDVHMCNMIRYDIIVFKRSLLALEHHQ